MSAGKGSAPRPFNIPHKEYEENHARVFGPPKKKDRYIPPPLPKKDK